MNTTKRIKTAIIIGVCAVMLSSFAVSGHRIKSSTESWFITWESLYETDRDSDGITIIKDESEDIEFRCGIIDIICSWFD